MIRTILLVDDDMEFAEACRNFLEAAGYTVVCETDGSRTVERIRQVAPDVILLDIFLGDRPVGFDIVQVLCEDAALARVPVVFLTGYFTRADADTSSDDALAKWPNVRYILDKPVKPAVLLSIIKRLAADAGSGGQ